MPRQDLFYVGGQVALFVLIAVDPFGARWALPIWISMIAWGVAAACVVLGVLAVFQLGTNLTPWPSPKSGSVLVTSGLYAYARHPIYASLLWFAVALSLATGSPGRAVATVALYALFCRKAAYEEQLLKDRYPAYETYAREVGRFRP